MASIHFILQGKGGVGKSMIGSNLYQVFTEQGYVVIAYDTDPVNKTLSGYKEFNVHNINLLKADGNIDSRKFDEMLEELANAPADSHVIVDNGASSFIALASYLKENDVLQVLEEEYKHKIFFHTVITGGQAIGDTVEGLATLAKNFRDSKIVVWLNPFFGAVEMDGKVFTDFKVYKEYQDSIHALIELPMGNKDLIGKDLEQLFAKRQSFKVGINSSNGIAVRSRLKKYWEQILSFVEQANLC